MNEKMIQVAKLKKEMREKRHAIGLKPSLAWRGAIVQTLGTVIQVNNGVLYFLDYVEDIYIRVLSVPVSILNPNHLYLPLLSTVYCNTM